MEVHAKNVDFIDIVDASGNAAGRLYFIPCDVGIVSRVQELTQLYPLLVEEVRPLNLYDDGTAHTAHTEDTEKLHEAETRLYNALDYACGVVTAQEAFKQYRPFAVVDGELWLTRVVQAIAKVMPRIEARIYEISRTAWSGNKKTLWRKRR